MLTNRQTKKFKKTEKGMAFVESIPVLFMVVVVFNFSMGFFGAIHSGILNSIASYNYAMETFRFRSNLMYFRPGGGWVHYQKSMNRVHGITADGVKNDDTNKKTWPATVRSIAFTDSEMGAAATRSVTDAYSNNAESTPTNIWGNISTFVPDDKEASGRTSPEIWVKTVYGICLSADCEGK